MNSTTTREETTVIYCPNKTAHPSPKILLFFSGTPTGTIYVQCRDRKCRKSSKNRGWFEIVFNGTGGYTITEVKTGRRFENNVVPYVALEDCE